MRACVSKCARLLTEAAELPDDVGQRDVGHTLQLVLDAPGQHRVAQVPGLDCSLDQRHPAAAAVAPAAAAAIPEAAESKKKKRAHQKSTAVILSKHLEGLQPSRRVQRLEIK